MIGPCSHLAWFRGILVENVRGCGQLRRKKTNLGEIRFLNRSNSMGPQRFWTRLQPDQPRHRLILFLTKEESDHGVTDPIQVSSLGSLNELFSPSGCMLFFRGDRYRTTGALPLSPNQRRADSITKPCMSSLERVTRLGPVACTEGGATGAPRSSKNAPPPGLS